MVKKIKEEDKDYKIINSNNITIKRAVGDPDDIKYLINDDQVKIRNNKIQVLDNKDNVYDEREYKGNNKERIKKLALKKFRESGTIKPGVKKIRLGRMTEYIDNDLKLNNLKENEKFQTAVTIRLNGKDYTARSAVFRNSKANIEMAKEHAINNLRRKISFITNNVSDASVGEKVIKEKGIKMRRSAIYYRQN